ncbi:unnamed protein product [Rotaria sp. Silwood1]|nr:unnamed protein product [Rotaria sp. Silwood1]CAF1007576.1 unnamed protein product [Rotaria sp. Silwood1]CAF3388198.1 unnamed protein product [Rotaria sp. Silwood1]
MIGGWIIDPTTYTGWICKLRAFLVFITRTIAPWLIVLATIDRWLLSSVDAHRRQKSTLKNAQRWTIIIIIFSILLYAQLFYCYEANLIDTPLECYGKTVACRYITDFSFSVITILCPLFFMILFGLLTISNVQQSQRRVQILQLQNKKPTKNKSSGSIGGNTEHKSKQRTERSLLRMLLVQVLLLTIFTFPLFLQKFYSTFSGEKKSPIEMAINMFLYNLAVLIYFVSNGMPFYIYTLCGGTVFRKALSEFVLMMKRKMMCQ